MGSRKLCPECERETLVEVTLKEELMVKGVVVSTKVKAVVCSKCGYTKKKEKSKHLEVP